MNFTKVIKSVKKHLVKKLTLHHSHIDENYIYYELYMQNFWMLKKKVEVFLSTKQETETQTQHIPFVLTKNKLTLKVPNSLVEQLNSRAIIEVVINNKKMWIMESQEFAKENRAFLMRKKYFITGVNKHISLNHKFTEFNFFSEKISCKNLAVGNDCLQFKINNLPTVDDEFEIYAFHNNKVHSLNATFNENKVSIDDFTFMSNGEWRLFLRTNNKMFPLEIKAEQKESTFSSLNHEIKILANNDAFYLCFQPHFFESRAIQINKIDNSNLSIQIETEMNSEDMLLIMEDTKTQVECSYDLQAVPGALLGSIPLGDLWKDYSRKRFFIKINGENPKKYQFHINKQQVSGSGITFEEAIESQVIIFSFYVRKDQSLGFRTLRPILKKEIINISDFKVSGYIGSLKAFLDCRAYLVFEERETLASKKVLVEDGFEVDMESLNLVDLKSKDKTIIDLYVELINQDNNVVRKEKIKYKNADYKKDNYYAHTIIKDKESNEHHFLVTTTPFKNIKLETFTIPAEIVVPEDTSQKDKSIWLIGERYDTAQDNGIILYKWLRKNTDIQAYYVIEEDSIDYGQIKKDPYVLAFGSPKHYEIAFKAGVLLGTHDLENLLPYKTAKGFFHYEETHKVFLQHGVLGRKNVEYHKKYYDVPFDVFIVSSDAEKYDIVVDKMGYDKDEVAVTGLARFDNLVQSKEPKDILLMPTWRDWINTDQQFLESEYYTTYLNLINNEELHKLLEEYNVNLNFYPHYRAQNFFERNMDTLENNIRFIPFGSRKVQDLLIEHALLITDYSTVSFDFIKMDKAVIHYHFDVNRFFRRGILRPIEETFIGGIAHTEEEIINLIKDRLKHRLENYDIDISGVIKYQDRSNCERIYQTVCHGLKQMQGK